MNSISSSKNLHRSSQRRCSVKKMFLKISQNSQDNTFLIKMDNLDLNDCFCHCVTKDIPLANTMPYRSSRQEVLCKQGFLKNVIKFTGKSVPEFLF